jgi:LysM repeat protein
LPHKKNKGEKLTSKQRRFNRRLAQIRVKVEHVNQKLKIFRIL